MSENENTKFLLLMGGSGCGKTTLAKKLEEFDPSTFYRSVEYSSRKIRDGEVDGVDYQFITKDELLFLYNTGELFESVRYQFPDMYGCNWDEIKEGMINVVIVSLEGFITAAESIKEHYPDSTAVLVNIINDCELDIAREGRDPLQEERINRAVILNLPMDTWHTHQGLEGKFTSIYYSENMWYHELPLSKLKTFRNDKNMCLEYFNGLFKD